MMIDGDGYAAGRADGDVLRRISAQLDGIGAHLEAIEDREIPELEQRWKQRLRRAIIYVALVVALGLSVVVWLSSRVNAAQNAQEARFGLANCRAVNQARADDLVAEKMLVAAVLSGTPGDRAKGARILAVFTVKDRLRDCEKEAASRKNP